VPDSTTILLSSLLDFALEHVVMPLPASSIACGDSLASSSAGRGALRFLLLRYVPRRGLRLPTFVCPRPVVPFSPGRGVALWFDVAFGHADSSVVMYVCMYVCRTSVE